MVTIAASNAGALKAYIEGLGLSLSAYRRRVPDGTARPYVRISERISVVPEAADNAYWDESESLVSEQVQVDLFQSEKNSDGSLAESYTLPDALARALHGAQLASSGGGAPPTRVFGVRLVQGPLELPDEENVVRHVITLELHRHL